MFIPKAKYGWSLMFASSYHLIDFRELDTRRPLQVANVPCCRLVFKEKILKGRTNVEITQQTALVCVCACQTPVNSLFITPLPVPSHFLLLGGAMLPSWKIWKSMGRMTTQIYIYIYYYIMDNNPAMFETTKQFGHGPAMQHVDPRNPSRLSSIASNMVFSSSSKITTGRQTTGRLRAPPRVPRHRQLSSLLPSNIFNQPFLKVSKSILKDRSIILVRAKGGTVQKIWSFWGLFCTFKSGWKRRVPMLGQQLATATWLQPKTRSNFPWGWHHHQQVFCTLVVCSSWFIHWATVTLTSSQSSKVWQSADWPKAGRQIGWYLAALWATTLSDCVLQSSLQI